ncbi:MAG: hypothetical protein ACUZ8E_17870 [Candidatus Anammoxibacter sp.]
MSGKYNGFVIEKGADFNPGLITWKDSAGLAIDITGYTARMDIKKEFEDDSILLLTTENSRITLGGVAGTIDLTITNADTTTLPTGNFKYDLELISGSSVVTRLLEGSLAITENVTT